MLALGPDGAFAAWEDGRAVGTTMTIAYGTQLAWIGVVLVDPDYRRRGIALALMQAACDRLQRCGVTTIKLDATPDGRLVYQKLGFVDECLFQRWRLDTPKPQSVADVSRGGWNEIAALDTAAFGVDRSALVQAIIADAGLPLVQRDKNGKVTGYASFRPGARASYVGPLVAEDVLTARSLLADALARTGDKPVIVDANVDFAGAVDLLRELGFVWERDLLRMRLGPDTRLSHSPSIFAIAGPEVG